MKTPDTKIYSSFQQGDNKSEKRFFIHLNPDEKKEIILDKLKEVGKEASVYEIYDRIDSDPTLVSPVGAVVIAKILDELVAENKITAEKRWRSNPRYKIKEHN